MSVIKHADSADTYHKADMVKCPISIKALLPASPRSRALLAGWAHGWALKPASPQVHPCIRHTTEQVRSQSSMLMQWMAGVERGREQGKGGGGQTEAGQ